MRFLFSVFFALLISSSCVSQTKLPAIEENNPDSVYSPQPQYEDSNFFQQNKQWDFHNPFWFETNKLVQQDVQQLNYSQKNPFVIIMLLLMLTVLTVVKVAFSKDWEELFQSVINQNIAQQIFRARSGKISVSSLLLLANFVIAFSLYAQFILAYYFHDEAFKSFSKLLFLIFLFTFFLIAKVSAIKVIGVMFELNEECEEYIFNFSAICKSVGLTLLPALFIFYVIPQKFFVLVFGATVFLLIAFALIFIWRWLSTSYKLLYRSAYHFFIYVCVVEISTIFLLFKLLTKTIT